MSEKQDYKLLQLEKDNYVLWKWQFRNILKAKKLMKVLEPGEVEDVDKDAQALALLGSALSPNEMLKIINCQTFKDAWRTIEENFENKTTYEPQSLFVRLNSFKINSAVEVSQGISEIKGIVAQLKNLNEKVSDNNVIGAIISSLPSSFEVFTTIWRNSSDQSLDSLVSKLMAEASVQLSKESNETKALAAGTSSNKKGNKKGKNKKNFDKNQCRYCKESGHWIKDCPNLKTPYDPNHGKKKDDKHNGNDKPEEDTFDLACMTKVEHGTFSQDIWIADSGCTHHMSPYKHLFSSFTRSSSTKMIRLADENMSLNVEGQGSIVTDKCQLKNVLYVPNLSQNLFSISAATRAGLTLIGSNEGLKFIYKNTTVFQADLQDKLYLIKLKPRSPLDAYVKSATINEWHARFNHVSPETIKSMMENKVVEGLQVIKESKEKCQDCQLNKCTRTHHATRSTPKATKAGNVLHVDTSGKSNVVSLGGSQYLVLCKDEASSYRQVSFVTTKDEIPNKVKEFISRTMLETGQSVLKLVTDNGTEFLNNSLNSFLKDKGIIHDRSVAYTPEQNGFIEREMRTLKEMARTLLTKSKLDKKLWAEAINCSVYTLNRVINSGNSGKTPFELWHQVKPNVKNLRIFGEVAILKTQKSKVEGTWDETGSKAIFVGYTDRFNTYRFLKDSKIVTSCDAVFLNKMKDNSEIEVQKRAQEVWISGDVLQDLNSVSINNSQDDPSDVVMYQSNDESTYGSPRSSSPQLLQVEETVSQNPSHQADPEPPRSNIPQQVAMNQPVGNNGISQFFGTNDDLSFTITQGQITDHFNLSDLEYRRNANNWINKKTGHFIKKDFINEIKRKIQNQRSQGQANISKVCEPESIPIPANYSEAINSTHHQGWKNAMDDEMNSLIKNEVFEVVTNDSVTKKPVGSRWVFVVKYKKNGEIEKFKARVLAKGFSQVYGIDYTETYCSVVQIMTTRLILAYAAQEKLAIRQFDVKTAFLYGELREEIYMNAPDGFAEPNTVWKLRRSLYGLKQSPRMWSEKFSSFMRDIGLEMSSYDNSVFFKWDPLIIIIVYVDDGLIFARNDTDIIKILKQLKDKFEIRELEVNNYRGLEVVVKDDAILIHQASYVKKILNNFNMANSNSVTNPIGNFEQTTEPLRQDVPYRQAIGSLMYLADTSRPDISFAVNRLARKVANPTESDWKQVKHLLRYLSGTVNLGIKYARKGSCAITSYSDSDYAGDTDTSKSTTGFVILFNNAVFHWKTQLQRHVTLSSTEAEVIALCSLSKELSWINRMSQELRIVQEEKVVIKCDNQSALRIAQSVKLSGRTRHLRAQNAYIYEQINAGELAIQHVKTDYNLADILTKNVNTKKFVANRDSMLTSVPQVRCNISGHNTLSQTKSHNDSK